MNNGFVLCMYHIFFKNIYIGLCLHQQLWIIAPIEWSIHLRQSGNWLIWDSPLVGPSISAHGDTQCQYVDLAILVNSRWPRLFCSNWLFNIIGGFRSIYQHTDVILETTSWYLRCDTNAAEPFVFGTDYMLPDTVVALNCYKCLYFMLDNQLVIGVIPCITVSWAITARHSTNLSQCATLPKKNMAS